MRWMPAKNLDYKWRPWFAWYPVSLSDTGQVAWLERVWRRVEGYHMYGPVYEYESYVGEKRELGPERLVPTAEEINGKGKPISEVMVYMKKEPVKLEEKPSNNTVS